MSLLPPLRPNRKKHTTSAQAMAKAAKEKTELPVAPQNDSARGSWHTATAGMYTKEGLAELRSSQAFTPKPSGGRSRERMTRGGVSGGSGEEGAAVGAAPTEQVFAGDEAEMVHEAGQQGDLKGVSCRGGGVTKSGCGVCWVASCQHLGDVVMRCYAVG